MDREVTYLALYEEVKLLKATTDKPLYDAHELDLLVRVNALTEAFLREVITVMEAKKLLRDYIQSLRQKEKPSEDGQIKF